MEKLHCESFDTFKNVDFQNGPTVSEEMDSSARNADDLSDVPSHSVIVLSDTHIRLLEGNENSIREDIARIIYTVGTAFPRSSAKQVGFCKRYREKGFKLLSYTPAEPCGLN